MKLITEDDFDTIKYIESMIERKSCFMGILLLDIELNNESKIQLLNNTIKENHID